MSDIEIKEGDVVSYKDILKVYDYNHDNERLKRIKLECLSCGHKDIVNGMRKEEMTQWETAVSPSPKPYPYRPTFKQIRPYFRHIKFFSSAKGIEGNTLPYKEFFVCPKCGSQMITLLEGELSKLSAEAL